MRWMSRPRGVYTCKGAGSERSYPWPSAPSNTKKVHGSNLNREVPAPHEPRLSTVNPCITRPAHVYIESQSTQPTYIPNHSPRPAHICMCRCCSRTSAWSILFGRKKIQNTKSCQTNTPPIPNYKPFQEFWRVKTFSRLTKIIEKNTKICNVKWVYYKNIIKKESNDT